MTKPLIKSCPIFPMGFRNNLFSSELLLPNVNAPLYQSALPLSRHFRFSSWNICKNSFKFLLSLLSKSNFDSRGAWFKSNCKNTTTRELVQTFGTRRTLLFYGISCGWRQCSKKKYRFKPDFKLQTRIGTFSPEVCTLNLERSRLICKI